jgi:hypothetical protein
MAASALKSASAVCSRVRIRQVGHFAIYLRGGSAHQDKTM